MADTSQDKKDGPWAGSPPPSSLPPRTSRAWVALLLAALSVLAVYLGWRQLAQEPARAPTPPAVEAPAVAAPLAPPGPEPATAPSKVSAGERAVLDAVSASPAFQRWLDQGDPINRWALVAANLAEGAVPRKALAFLAPAGPFEAARRGGQLQLSDASYRRYDTLGDVVASVDPGSLAVAYRTFHKPLEAAYRALGDPRGSLDAVAARALGRLARAQVLDQAPAVEPAGASGAELYVFTDPKLEALDALDKQLLRIGPRNARIVKSKAAAIRQALGLPR